MDTLALLTALVVMGAIVMALMAFYQATASPRSTLERRLGSVIGETTGAELTALGFESVRSRRTGHVPLIGPYLQGQSWTQHAATELERADVKLNVSEFVSIRLLLALLLCSLPLLLMGTGIFGLLLASGLGFVGYMLPRLYVGRGKRKRLQKLDEQLPDMLSMLSNSVKSGFGLMQSLDLVSREMSHPIATDIRRMLQEINVGATTDEALLNFSSRSGSGDLDIVVTAMIIQQSTGGNLSEILDNVEHTLRERIRIRGEIKTLTTQGVLSGFIVGGLPIFVGLALAVLNPGYISVLFTHIAGFAMLAVAGVLEMFGIFLIKRIMAIEV
jgi:tight adherence protein B